MLMYLYKLLLTLSATSWMGVIYAIKSGWTIGKMPSWLFGVLLLFVPVLLSLLALFLSRCLGKESGMKNIKEFSLADGEFLPIYLGYFFVSVGVTEHFTMLIVYLVLFIFTFCSQTQYFNPVFLLLGYHYYHISTEEGTKTFVIRKGKVIRNIENLEFSNLYRLNDTTFIERG